MSDQLCTAKALLSRWLNGMVPVGDYKLRDETEALLAEPTITITLYEHTQATWPQGPQGPTIVSYRRESK